MPLPSYTLFSIYSTYVCTFIPLRFCCRIPKKKKKKKKKLRYVGISNHRALVVLRYRYCYRYVLLLHLQREKGERARMCWPIWFRNLNSKVSTSLPTKSTAHLTCQFAQANGHACYRISGTDITPNSQLWHRPLTWVPGSTTLAIKGCILAHKTVFGTRIVDGLWHDPHQVWH